MDVWVNVDFEPDRVVSLGLVDAQALPGAGLLWVVDDNTAAAVGQYCYQLACLWRPSPGMTSWAICLSLRPGPCVPLQTPFSSLCRCHLLTVHIWFPGSSCLWPWPWKDTALGLPPVPHKMSLLKMLIDITLMVNKHAYCHSLFNFQYPKESEHFQELREI